MVPCVLTLWMYPPWKQNSLLLPMILAEGLSVSTASQWFVLTCSMQSLIEMLDPKLLLVPLAKSACFAVGAVTMRHTGQRLTDCTCRGVRIASTCDMPLWLMMTCDVPARLIRRIGSVPLAATDSCCFEAS